MIRSITKLSYQKRKGKFPYLLLQDLRVITDAPWAQTNGKRYLFCTDYRGNELVLGSLYNGEFAIFPPYQSDGATMAPDFKKILRRIFFHDIQCQFCNVADSPFTRKESDDFFHEGMKLDQFRLADLYHKGVRFGANFLQSPPDKNLYIRTIETSCSPTTTPMTTSTVTTKPPTASVK